MGTGEIVDMDIVPEAGSVGGGVVGTKNFYMLSFTRKSVEDEGDEVSFGGVVFADRAVI